jgi:outer membrane protein OmpA-like peptidoglycan-associated protein
MKPAGIRWVGGMVALAVSSALASSCSLLTHAPFAATLPDARSANAPAGRITQIQFGRQAAFAQCVPPACPAVTPKTLALEAQATPESSRPIDVAASLAEREALVLGGTAAPTAPAAIRATAARPEEPLTRQVVVHFAFGDATLTPAARALIDELANPLASARRIAITGRTDGVGPQQSNQLLAMARANAVRDHLRARYPHLAPVVTLEAQGTCCYAASNDTPQGRALNRRVEVVFEREAMGL